MSSDYNSRSLRIPVHLDNAYKVLTEHKATSCSSLIRTAMINFLKAEDPDLYKEYLKKAKQDA